jgi:hypothetical protein
LYSDRVVRRAVSILVVLSLSAPVIAAPDKASCLKAHEEAQKLRTDNKLRDAREKLLVCAADACPSLVKVDCTKWLPEVDRDQPTVIVRAKEGKNDLTDVKVEIDGVIVASYLDGKPIAVDPGAHALKIERSGSTPIEQKLVVASGEKNRLVKVVFAALPVETPSPSPNTESSMLPWVLSGVGAAGIAGFAILGITTRSRISELRGTCAPNCDPGEESSLRTRLILADVSLVIGLASLGAATYLFMRPTPSTSVALTPLPSGAFASFHASF